MTKLIVALRNFENASKTKKKCKIKLKYNYSLIQDFSSKTPSTTYPKQGSLGKIRPTYYILKKRRKTIKILPYLAFILVADDCPTKKIKKYFSHERAT
jgi:hypothetical protein